MIFWILFFLPCCSRRGLSHIAQAPSSFFYQRDQSKVHKPLRSAGPFGIIGNAGISSPDIWVHLMNKYTWNIEKLGLQGWGLLCG